MACLTPNLTSPTGPLTIRSHYPVVKGRASQHPLHDKPLPPTRSARERCYVGVWGLGPQINMHHDSVSGFREQKDPEWCAA